MVAVTSDPALGASQGRSIAETWWRRFVAEDREQVLAQAVLLGCGLAMAAVCLTLVAGMSLPEWIPGTGVAVGFVEMLGKDWRNNWVRLYGSFGALAALWLPVLVAVRSLPPARAKWLLFALPVLSCLVLAFHYPALAADFLHNLADGRLLWKFHLNPMQTPPGETFPLAITYGDEPSAYGPLWFIVLAPPVFAGGDDMLRGLIMLKLYMSVFFVAAAVVVWFVSRRLTPGREAFAVALFLWNPFLLLRFAGNAHNDIVMLFFLLLAVWAVVEERWELAVPAVMAAVLVKWTCLLVGPAFAVAALRRPLGEWPALWRKLGIGSALALAMAVAIFRPFWAGQQTFDSVQKQYSGHGFITSTPLLVADRLINWFGTAPKDAEDQARTLCTIAFMLVVALLLWRQRGGRIPLLTSTVLVLFSYLVLAAGWYRPWYMTWPLALAVLLPGRWWVAVVVAMSLGGLTPDVIEQYRIYVPFLLEHSFLLLALPVYTAFLPAVAVWLSGIAATGRLHLLQAEGTGGAHRAALPPGPLPETEG